MSTLKVNNVTDLGDDAVITAGALVGAGKILQVVSVTKTDTFSFSLGAGATTAITGMSASITPASASNKVLVMVDANAHGDSGTFAHAWGLILKRGATAISIGDTAGSRVRVTTAGFAGTNNHGGDNAAFTVLDSPSTTSSVTYSVDIYNGESSTRTLRVNTPSSPTDANFNFRGASRITLMEVAG